MENLQKPAAVSKVPQVNLIAQYESLKEEIDEAIRSVVSSQQFILGPKVEECENLVAKYSGARFACGVSSGTDALLAALMAEGIGAGDEVITTAYSFFATAGSVARLRAKPVFADIDPETFNINTPLIEKKITPQTRAIIPVHLFGQTADMKTILSIAKKHRLVVIEDAAQAIGAGSEAGRAGSIGDYGCFSFYPTKNLNAFGDGGMVLTSDRSRIEKLKMLRTHGSKNKYEHAVIGGNFRLDAIQAAVVSVKLKHLESWTERRQRAAARYTALFEERGLANREVAPPSIREERHVFNQYVVRAKDRDRLEAFLKANGIGCEVFYPAPLPLQECFAYLGHKKGDFPESEKASLETLALPMYAELTDEQIEQVVETVSDFYGK